VKLRAETRVDRSATAITRRGRAVRAGQALPVAHRARDVAGALTKTAKTAGKDGVAAARAVLAVEGGGAWGMVKDDLDERIDEVLNGFTPDAN